MGFGSNPPEWVEWLAVPWSEEAANALKTRTLTALYNTRPQWLADAHAALDAAVAAAYGWDAAIAEDEALGELLAMNLEGFNIPPSGSI